MKTKTTACIIGAIAIFLAGGAVRAQTVDTTPPSAPTNLSATPLVGTMTVNLMWVPSYDATGVTAYTIMRDGAVVGTAAAASPGTYADTVPAAGTYSYKITARDGAQNVSGDSNTATAVVSTAGTPPPPPVISMMIGNGAPGETVVVSTPATVTLRWSIANAPVSCTAQGSWSGATSEANGSFDFFYTAEGTYSYAMTCNNGGGTRVGSVSAKVVAPPPASTTTTTATTTTTQTTTATQDTIATPPDTTPPSVPSGLQATWNMGTVTQLRWTASTDNVGVASYKVLRNNTVIATTTLPYYYDTNFAPGTRYSYMVSASDMRGNESQYSSAVAVDIPALSTSTTTAAVPPAQVVSTTTAATSAVYSMTYPTGTVSAATTTGAAGTAAQQSTAASMSSQQAATTLSATPATTTPGTILGVAKDFRGTSLPGVSVDIAAVDGSSYTTATTDDAGAFSLSVHEGSYRIKARPILGRPDIVPPGESTISVPPDTSVTADIIFIAPSKKIVGRVSYPDGSPVIDAEVGAYSPTSGQWVSDTTTNTGAYTLRVGPGVWQVGVRPIALDAAQWYYALRAGSSIVFGKTAVAEARTKNIVVTAKNATVRVIVVDDTGLPLPATTVVIRDAGNAIEGSFSRTGTDGTVEIPVSAGSHTARIYVDQQSGLLPADDQAFTAVAGKSMEVKVTVKKSASEQSVTVTGIVRTGNGTRSSTSVFARSSNGGFVATRANDNGEFSLTLPKNSAWKIAAATTIDGYPFRSSETNVAIGTDAQFVEIVIIPQGQKKIADPVRVVESTGKSATAQTDDGMRVSVPEGAVGQSQTESVEIKPSADAPSQPGARVIGSSYDVVMADAQGKDVRTLSKDIEISIPYSPAELKKFGIKEDALTPSYFDETVGAWVKLDNFVIDKANHKVIARVRHFTRFALVAAADTTPPAAPTKISVRRSKIGLVISWVRPVADFDHIKVYRSTKSGDLGSPVVAETRSTFAIDSRVASGTAYWYTVRAIDPAGNESENTAQVSAIASAPVAADKAFGRLLYAGSRGDDVSLLQQILIEEDVYPEASVTGYFSPATKKAVARLQEKYADTLLVPFRLTKGNGYVNAPTRKKLNEINKKITGQLQAATH